MNLTTLLEQLEKLERAATPGKWKAYGDAEDGIDGIQSEHLNRYGNPESIVYSSIPYEQNGVNGSENLNLIIQARNALPQLIPALRDAIEMAKFYGQYGTWDPDKFLTMSDAGRNDIEETPRSRFTPGKKARAWLEKYGVKE